MCPYAAIVYLKHRQLISHTPKANTYFTVTLIVDGWVDQQTAVRVWSPWLVTSAMVQFYLSPHKPQSGICTRTTADWHNPSLTHLTLQTLELFLACDAFIRTNRHSIAMMFIRLSVCLGWARIVILRCKLVWIMVYGWIVQCSGHLNTKACPPIPNRLFPVPSKRELGYGCAN